MSIESLKQQARRHEQNEEWDKALDQYLKAIEELSQDEQTDIGLINRVGDIFVRVGKLDQAVKCFEQAVDLYREAFLPNNAIAVCKKIIRSAPNRHQVYLKIGQVRAEQGFLPDARANFLTYAERMMKAGDLDESFRALVEFCDLAPDDVQVRITVADQMAANKRTAEAVQQLLIAHRQLTQSGEVDLASGVEKKVLALDPNANVGAAFAAGSASGVSADGEIEAQFGEIEIGGAAPDEEEEPTFAIEAAAGGLGAEDDAGDEGEELPMMSFAEADEAAEEQDVAIDLPLMGFAEIEEEAPELPMISFGEEEVAEEEVPELPLMTFEPEPPPSGGPSHAIEEAIEEAVAERALPPKPAPAPAKPAAAPARPAAAEPPAAPNAPDTGYIDLGAMILGGGDPKSTRFKVAYEEPSGDEGADFAKMLSQFKEKVSENIEAGDVRAHYDLGTAYKEMGLLEEAVGSFQSVLRASGDHLPTYEIMGQTFLEMGEPEAAVKTLQRALQVKPGVEDEFVGIYYYLARAHEALGQKESELEFYDRVFSLDINFADVTERLRGLR
ncbi:MAG: tetratricopeptide repeat protein [Gemmatimonadetes bacterium]|nr:tetratricopeptide repeat protein [Gemmatimonadota bacterium]